MTKFKSLALLLFLGFLSSCEKETLISKENIRDFKIDTLFYKGLNLTKFSVREEPFGPDPVQIDNHLYVTVVDGASPLISRSMSLYKLDAENGTTLWKWSDYNENDAGYIKDLSYRDGELLLCTSDNAYLVDVQSGQTLHTYMPPDSNYMQDAVLLDHHILMAYNDQNGAYLLQLNKDGSNPLIVYSLIRSANYWPYGGSLKVFKNGGDELLTYQVADYSSPLQPTDLHISRLSDPYNFYILPMGAAPNAFIPIYISNNQLIILNPDGRINSGSLFNFRVSWSHVFPADELFENENNFYLPSLAIIDKSTGKFKYSNPSFKPVLGVSDKVIVAQGSPGLHIYDAQTADFLFHFGESYNIHGVLHTGSNEFFFADGFNNGRIGKIRITEKFK